MDGFNVTLFYKSCVFKKILTDSNIFIYMQESDDQYDQSLLRQIDCFDDTDYERYHTDYEIVNLRHYLTIQLKWMATAKYYVGLKLHKNPSDIELLQDWEIHRSAARFRVFYILKYPDMVLNLTLKSDCC